MRVVFSSEHIHSFQHIPKVGFNPKARLKIHWSLSFFMVWFLPPSLPSFRTTLFFVHWTPPTLTLPLSLKHPSSFLLQSLLLVIIFPP